MPWCPKCRSEYRDGYTLCKDCGEELVDRLTPLNKRTAKPNNNGDEWVLLGEFNYNTKEGEVVKSILESMEIPVLKKYPLTGGYTKIYMEMAPQEQIYVPRSCYQEAVELLQNSSTEPPEDFYNQKDEEEEEEQADFPVSYPTRRYIGGIIIIVMLLFPLIFTLIGRIIEFSGGLGYHNFRVTP